MNPNGTGGLAAELVLGDTAGSSLNKNQSTNLAIAAKVVGKVVEFLVGSAPLGPISHVAAGAAGMFVEEATKRIGTALLEKLAVRKTEDTVQNAVHEKRSPH